MPGKPLKPEIVWSDLCSRLPCWERRQEVLSPLSRVVSGSSKGWTWTVVMGVDCRGDLGEYLGDEIQDS